tara:strand:+ start:22471 stop:23505 length:1035 start_codon:yes stop_codon:yes gene_type:complete
MNTSTSPVELDIKTLYKKSKVDLNKEPEAPPVCFEIGGIPVATFGNFSLITGKAKSKKTFLVSLIVKCLLSENPQNEFISSPNKISEIIFVDTEQSMFDVYNVANRMFTNPKDKKRLRVYSLRSLGRLDRKRLIKDIIKNIKPKSLLIIDGLRDLVSSVNDEEQASEINDLLLRATEEKETHIIGVLHQNKVNKNPRGHLGTEMTNKAETVISVAKVNSATSKVTATQCRRVEFSGFQFTVDENGVPFIENYLVKNKRGRRKKLPSEIEKKTHKEILESIDRSIESKKPSYKEILNAIKDSVENEIEPIGGNKAKEYLNYYEVEKFIIRKGIKHTTDSYYQIDI